MIIGGKFAVKINANVGSPTVPGPVPR